MTKLEKIAYKADVITPSAEEEQKSKDFLEAHMQDIRHDLELIRKKIDSRFKDSPRFPMGYCGEIATAVYRVIKFSPKIEELKGVQAIRRHVKEAGDFRQVYVIQNGAYFQNAFQLGRFWIDVAYDTVTPNDPIDIQDVREVEIENIDSYIRYAEIAELYWRKRIFSNTLYPKIARFFPLIGLNRSGQLQVDPTITPLTVKNLLQDGALVHAFFDSTFAQRTFPEECENIMRKYHSELIRLYTTEYYNTYKDDDEDSDCGVERTQSFMENMFTLRENDAVMPLNYNLKHAPKGEEILHLYDAIKVASKFAFPLDTKTTELLCKTGIILPPL